MTIGVLGIRGRSAYLIAPHIIVELKTSSDDSMPSAISALECPRDRRRSWPGKDEVDENSRQQKLAAFLARRLTKSTRTLRESES